uniref:ARAD1D12408p n=1 Tax=Blastobotrys adeninivorans TaxID=409370 RepID=A0A060TE30_BLAAD
MGLLSKVFHRDGSGYLKTRQAANKKLAKSKHTQASANPYYDEFDEDYYEDRAYYSSRRVRDDRYLEDERDYFGRPTTRDSYGRYGHYGTRSPSDPRSPFDDRRRY